MRRAAALLLAGAAVPAQSSDSNVTVRPLVPPAQQGSLEPGKQTLCPSRCTNYFAGASADEPLVCQYAASGVGTIGQREGGVSCYPSYNCGQDWTMCQQLPADDAAAAPLASARAQEACAEVAGLTAGGAAPTPLGRWLKGNGDLGCGWGSTYGNVDPFCGSATGCTTEGWDGTPKPFTVEYWNEVGVEDEYSCCLKAMELEKTPFDEGGAAVRFQYRGYVK